MKKAVYLIYTQTSIDYIIYIKHQPKASAGNAADMALCSGMFSEYYIVDETCVAVWATQRPPCVYLMTFCAAVLMLCSLTYFFFCIGK